VDDPLRFRDGGCRQTWLGKPLSGADMAVGSVFAQLRTIPHPL